MILFQCASCQRMVKVGEELAGKRGQCPYCTRVLMIPNRSVERVPATPNYSTRLTAAIRAERELPEATALDWSLDVDEEESTDDAASHHDVSEAAIPMPPPVTNESPAETKPTESLLPDPAKPGNSPTFPPKPKARNDDTNSLRTFGLALLVVSTVVAFAFGWQQFTQLERTKYDLHAVIADQEKEALAQKALAEEMAAVAARNLAVTKMEMQRTTLQWKQKLAVRQAEMAAIAKQLERQKPDVVDPVVKPHPIVYYEGFDTAKALDDWQPISGVWTIDDGAMDAQLLDGEAVITLPRRLPKNVIVQLICSADQPSACGVALVGPVPSAKNGARGAATIRSTVRRSAMLPFAGLMMQHVAHRIPMKWRGMLGRLPESSEKIMQMQAPTATVTLQPKHRHRMRLERRLQWITMTLDGEKLLTQRIPNMAVDGIRIRFAGKDDARLRVFSVTIRATQDDGWGNIWNWRR